MEWLYLIIASILEVGWIFSLKKINFHAIKGISFHLFTEKPTESIGTLLPLVGYAVFGLGNIYFFSLAMKKIPASTAFAVWMAITLAGVKAIEVVFFKEPIKMTDYLFLALLVIAIMGLKKN
jgi:quaternary ammonium compound-resistance protein SugE